MKTKSIFPLFLLAGTLLTAACATPTAKQAGNNSFEWGQVPQQPDLSWADSVGSRQMPGNHVILSANSFGAVADSTVLSTEAIQLCRHRWRNGSSSAGILSDWRTVHKKRCQPATGQRGDFTGQPIHSSLSRIPFADCRNRDDMARGSYQHCQ